MRTWWRLRQWVYARPPIAGALIVALLSLVGVSGWATARWVTNDTAPKTAVMVHRVTLVKTVRVNGSSGRASTRPPEPAQLAVASPQTRTVVETRRVPRLVHVVRTVTRVVTTVAAPRPVTNVRTRTVFDKQTVTQTATKTVSVNHVLTRPAQTVTVSQAKPRPAQTVTVTHVQTQPAQTVVRTVTTTSVQAQPVQTVVSTVTVPPGHSGGNGPPTQTVTVTVAAATTTVTVTRGH